MKKVKLLLPLCGLAVATAFSACTKSLNSSHPSLAGLDATDSSNYADSVAIGLWAYYTFNGNLNDQSGNNRNMTGYDSIGLTTDINGNANSALNFTGKDTSGRNTYAVIDSGINFPASSFSVSFLMLTRSTAGRIFEKADYNNALGASITFDSNPQSSTATEFDLGVTDNTDVCSTYTTSSNTYFLQLTNAVSLNTWYYVTFTYNGSVEDIYINGDLIGSTSTPGNLFTVCPSAPFYLGMWWLEDLHPFNGIIDDLRIYTRALSLGEIQYLASSESSSL